MFKVTIRYTDFNEKAVKEFIESIFGMYLPSVCSEGYEQEFSTLDYHDIERCYRLLIAGTITFYSVEFYQ